MEEKEMISTRQKISLPQQKSGYFSKIVSPRFHIQKKGL